MPMIEGAVVIDPVTGSATGLGMAKEAFDVLDAAADYGDFSGPDLAAAREANATFARAVAKVITHIQLNGQVLTSVAPGIAVATAGTAVAQVGATTAPGVGTGSVL